MSKVWKFNIKIDLGKAKELTVSGVIGGVLIAVLAEGAATTTHLVIDHHWKSVVPSDEKRPATPAQTRADPLGYSPPITFRDRWSATFAFQAAPASFVPWWLSYEELSPNALNGARNHNFQRDHQAPVVPTARPPREMWPLRGVF